MTDERRHEERRNAPRLPYYAEVRVVGAEETYFHPASNLSLGGVFLRTEFPLKNGTRLQVHLAGTGESGPLELEGTVVWCQQAAQPGTPEALAQPPIEAGMGVSFVEPREEVLEKLRTVVAELSRERVWEG